MPRRVSHCTSLLALLLGTGLLAIGVTTFASFATTAGAAALKQPFALAGATGTGNNAPPVGSKPFNAKLWDAKNYRIPHHASSCPQPPKSNSARQSLVNSPTTLTYYGLPTLADESGNLAKWQSIVLHAQTRVCDYTTPIKNGKPIVNNGGSTPNNYWGGYGNQCTSGCYSYYAADWIFYVPSINSSASTDDSIWVGVGGANGSKQAFSQTGVSEDSTGFINTYNAFYESNNCGKLNQEEDAFSTSPGNWMYFYTNRDGHDILQDTVTGKFTSKFWGCSSADTAEFIIERNNLDCCSAPLANYHSLTAFYAEFEDATDTWYRVNALGSLYTWNLVNGSNQPEETQGSITNDPTYGSQWTWTWVRGS
ncbi:MAG TPA: hypothetical protein VJN88_00240 [Ktedonobacterales bacterium]|nr:hypothetical protein [Ktedonobacterales bacterium]